MLHYYRGNALELEPRPAPRPEVPPRLNVSTSMLRRASLALASTGAATSPRSRPSRFREEPAHLGNAALAFGRGPYSLYASNPAK